MGKFLQSFVKLDKAEALATISIFIGLPLAATLYFDYRAGILVFSLAGAFIGLLALRK